MLLLYVAIAFAVGEGVQAQRQRRCYNTLGFDDCPRGYRCQNGRCVRDTGYPDPCIRTYCGPGYTCVYGKCVPDEKFCRSSLECAEYEACINRKCVLREKKCRYDWECEGGGRCEKGHCLGGGGPKCITHLQCGRNQRCENRICIPIRAICRYRCAYDEKCENGICVPDIKPTTQTSHLCLPYSIKPCPRGYRCRSGVCEKGTTIPTWCSIYIPRSCPPGYRCKREMCEKDVLTQPGTCGSDRPCTYPDRCIAGYCVPIRVITD